MSRVDNIREKYNGQTKLYDFYRECYPTDTEMIDDVLAIVDSRDRSVLFHISCLF